MGKEESGKDRAFADEGIGKPIAVVNLGGESQADGYEDGVRWKVFVDNLSRRVSRGALWELFSHYGRVNHVFISMTNKKPKYRVSTFAFVRFGSKKAMNLAIEKTNNSKIDGRIITVSKAKFPISTRRKVRSHNPGFKKLGPEGGGVSNQVNPSLIDPQIKGTKPTGLDSRIFKDVLIGKSESIRQANLVPDGKIDIGGKKHKSLFDIHIPAKDITWIDCSLVGVLKHYYDLEFVQRALVSDGLNAKVARWGNFNLSCIITFNSMEDKEEAWSKRDVGLSFWFSHVANLLKENGVPAAFFTVSLVGVPLHCWHDTFFKSLGNRWRTYIAIEEATREMLDFSVAKLIIRAESPFDILSTLIVRSLDRHFVIKTSIVECFKVKEVMTSDLEGGNFADVWSMEKPSAGGDQRVTDHYSQSSPSVGELSEFYGIVVPRDCAIDVDLDPPAIHGSKIIPLGHGNFPNADNPGKNDSVNGPFEDDGLPRVGPFIGSHGAHLDEVDVRPNLHQDLNIINAISTRVGPDGSTKQSRSNWLNGLSDELNCPLVDNSNDLGEKLHTSPTFEFVPESFDGMDNASSFKEFSGGLGQCVESIQNNQLPLVVNFPCSSRNGFRSSSQMRAIRLSIRNALNEPGSKDANSKPNSLHEDPNILQEAVAV
ncbi:hypothetical protein V6N13_102058 [Hibiscus sabdariffa]|uniref:RRM domain-containing protein n=1 Tax=Hibiscus sabdariffa TaxID=183260 RepID=A0ABR2D2X7_9ROSI